GPCGRCRGCAGAAAPDAPPGGRRPGSGSGSAAGTSWAAPAPPDDTLKQVADVPAQRPLPELAAGLVAAGEQVLVLAGAVDEPRVQVEVAVPDGQAAAIGDGGDVVLLGHHRAV